ncbi:hypothetical protein D7Y13_43190, partial [Corallococcus praedator]
AILFLFGLLNAGVVLGATDAATWLVLAGLLVGKPVGILLAGWLAVRVLGLALPAGMTLGDVLVVGCVAAIGFTVALFVAGVAFPPDAMLGGAPIGDPPLFPAPPRPTSAGTGAEQGRRDPERGRPAKTRRPCSAPVPAEVGLSL